MWHPNYSSTTTTTRVADPGFRNWNTPIPYLFGGLALMMGFIAVALTILACSYRQSYSNPASNASGHHRRQQNPAGKQVDDVGVDDSEPKIVVILAGQANPTHLANPISSEATRHIQPPELS
ncbi:hypothetical protein FNV43_RR13656 [Rhamnella rubrinervis]|uniref:Uncharacterized protein n=1 Tax=Rhamnella rubrinervis TaxID=2594499 RepID=A0A8K0H1F7_9ROSA|nr:hypothetical protein FNV43_RR13656 [Rhamnella rubrinervis]